MVIDITYFGVAPEGWTGRGTENGGVQYLHCTLCHVSHTKKKTPAEHTEERSRRGYSSSFAVSGCDYSLRSPRPTPFGGGLGGAEEIWRKRDRVMYMSP